VDRPGVPVLVKVSYFPNWRATGAEGPYRVAPNLMVVVPSGRHVELSYGRTWVEHLAAGLSAVGLVGLVLLRRRPPPRLAPGSGTADGPVAPRRPPVSEEVG
ncbi:MAG TPA: hypothetical protein VFW63_08860, partial [Acidimicrobiales bacterium]|nr:hypothetical protein [Acidimicrobiales bacterium]